MATGFEGSPQGAVVPIDIMMDFVPQEPTNGESNVGQDPVYMAMFLKRLGKLVCPSEEEVFRGCACGLSGFNAEFHVSGQVDGQDVTYRVPYLAPHIFSEHFKEATEQDPSAIDNMMAAIDLATGQTGHPELELDDFIWQQAEEREKAEEQAAIWWSYHNPNWRDDLANDGLAA